MSVQAIQTFHLCLYSLLFVHVDVYLDRTLWLKMLHHKGFLEVAKCTDNFPVSVVYYLCPAPVGMDEHTTSLFT